MAFFGITALGPPN
jgi:hypothetical protein